MDVLFALFNVFALDEKVDCLNENDKGRQVPVEDVTYKGRLFDPLFQFGFKLLLIKSDQGSGLKGIVT